MRTAIVTRQAVEVEADRHHMQTLDDPAFVVWLDELDRQAADEAQEDENERLLSSWERQAYVYK